MFWLKINIIQFTSKDTRHLFRVGSLALRRHQASRLSSTKSVAPELLGQVGLGLSQRHNNYDRTQQERKVDQDRETAQVIRRSSRSISTYWTRRSH